MPFPVNARWRTRTAGTTPVEKAWADAIDDALNGIYGAARSLLGVALDATGNVAQSVAARTIKAFGGALDLQSDTGLVTVTGPAGLKVITGAGGQGTLAVNDTTMAYGGTGQQCYPFEAQGNGTKIFRTVIGAVQTTDATTAKTAITIVGMPDPSAMLITSYVIGVENSHGQNETASQLYVHTFTRVGGNPIEANSAVKVLSTVSNDLGVTLVGSTVGAWAPSGANLIWHVQGKAATTINWLVKADILINV